MKWTPIATIILLAALFTLGHGSWHTQMSSLGNGITSFFTGSP